MSIELLEELDSHAALRNGLLRVSQDQNYWAGIPMPLGEDNPLVVEPKYPKATELTALFGPKYEPVPDGVTFRNEFYSTRWRCRIGIWEEDGKIVHGKIPAVHSLDQQISTLGASVAWGIEQEAKALQLLATLLPHHAFKHYLLTGSFLETSTRSGITYMFRKLRPTVAITSRDEHGEPERECRILCTLCLHPIAYYSNSWAGAMCPTDDVIAHLMLMRGDEPMFWRRANQHPAGRPESGL